MPNRSDHGESVAPVLLGRYRLLKKIAVGGMAEIYLARVSGAGGFEKNVVVKRILPQLAESDEFFRMFLDEARIAATLQHPNVVQVFDAQEQDGEHFIAMEFLDGADLHTIRRILAEKRQGLPVQHSVFIVGAVAAGLHYAHDKLGLDGQPLRIVHRDVTPQNILLTREGGVKLVDFGIAKAANRASSTGYGTLKGKLAYMSPEQCRSEVVDRRSDIFSLGIILFELTTGKRLYRGKSEYEILREIVEGSVPPPSTLVPGYPADLEQIVLRALARDREERYQTARELEHDLEQFARNRRVVGSSLALAQFVEPLIAEAQNQAEARLTRRAGGAAARAAAEARGSDRSRRSSADASAAGRDESGSASGARHRPRASAAAAVPKPGASGGGGARSGADARARDRDRDQQNTEVATPVRARPTAPSPGGPDVTPHSGSLPLPMPLLDTGQIRLRRSRVGPVLVLLALAGAAAATFYYVRTQQGAAGAAASADAGPAARPPPAMGAVQIDSQPDGAAVWLRLGLSPVTSLPVDPTRPYLLRVQRDGYLARQVTVEPASFHSSADDHVAEVKVELEAGGGTDRPPPEPTEMPGAAAARSPSSPAVAPAPAQPPDGRLHITTEPADATVWLLVGLTPARLGPIATDRPRELRLGKMGFLPAFVSVAPAQFDPAGHAHVSATLNPEQGGALRAASTTAIPRAGESPAAGQVRFPAAGQVRFPAAGQVRFPAAGQVRFPAASAASTASTPWAGAARAALTAALRLALERAQPAQRAEPDGRQRQRHRDLPVGDCHSQRRGGPHRRRGRGPVNLEPVLDDGTGAEEPDADHHALKQA